MLLDDRSTILLVNYCTQHVNLLKIFATNFYRSLNVSRHTIFRQTLKSIEFGKSTQLGWYDTDEQTVRQADRTVYQYHVLPTFTNAEAR